ncbi:MAG: ATP-dependent DNA helicase RecQ [Deltaproteobacteria bacterium]|nr:ATP-dependent DNA helicase RecQ [Deltaproteobacteria bacterium]
MNTLLSDSGQLLWQSRQLLEKVFGFRDFRPGQEAILEAIFCREDTLVVMPTGGGKSLCYQLPALILPGTCLVISPLIALMKDQVDSLRVLELPAVSINSLMSLAEQEGVLGKIPSGAYKIIYASPERLRNGPFMNVLKKISVSLVAVDEAHCISEWGHDFRPDYLRIGQALDWLGRPQTIALTATATARVREDIIQQLRLRSPRQFITGFDRKNLYFEVAPIKGPENKILLLIRRLADLQGGAIVYTGTRKNVEAIVRHLNRAGVEAVGYHAGMEEEERNRIQDTFLEGQANLIVATNAFGMGIDRSDIRMVIHHQLPGTLEAYYQECGRAGRDGEPSLCLLLFSAADRRLQEFFIESSYPSREVILGVYQALLGRPEDPIWLTYREIGGLCQPPAAEMAVASSLRILEEAGVVHRLHRYENRAELYLKIKPDSILKSLPRKPSAKVELLKTLCDHYTEDELLEGIQFLPEEIMAKANLSKETFRRIVSDLEEKGEGTYIPPFRGRGLRLMERTPSGELKIDFQRLHLRKAYELEKLNQIMAYGTLNRCRRAFLLEYFGEYYLFDNCDGCDVCQVRKVRCAVPGEEMDQLDPLLGVKILSGVARLRGRFGQGMAAKMLTGSREKSLERFRLQQLSTYGLLAGFSQEQVEKWIQELMDHGYLKRESTLLGEKNYSVVLLTPEGKEAMKKRARIALSPPVPKKKPPEKAVTKETDRGLFEELRKLRLQLARKEGLPPYCIFHDRTLQEMANHRPVTPQGMMAIAGVGEITFRKYGQFFLDLISSHTPGEGKTEREAKNCFE